MLPNLHMTALGNSRSGDDTLCERQLRAESVGGWGRMLHDYSKAPPLVQSVKIPHQLAGGAEDFDQQINHVVVQQKRVWQVFAAP